MNRERAEYTAERDSGCFAPRIKVIGLGGGGSNAVDRMITVGIPGVDYIAANTDKQSLACSEAAVKVQLGPQVTRGLGAGGEAEVGRAAAQESEAALHNALAGADMVFIAAGMGGGTGTGSAPVAARIARELGALVVGVVTTPFAFEGAYRGRTAQAGLRQLAGQVHTLIEVRNDLLLEIAPRDLRLEVAFRVADDVLRQGIQGITELVTQTGLINLDFANVQSVIRHGGRSLMAIGHGKGDARAEQAAEAAVHHPLLDHSLINQASALLVHITGGTDLGLDEVSQVMCHVSKTVCPSAEILFGASEDPEMDGRVQVIMIATGIQATSDPIAVHSLFGVPTPAAEDEPAPQPAGSLAPEVRKLDLPAFMRRRELFNPKGLRGAQGWAAD